MLLHQRGQLDLDTPLGELLPGFVVGRDSARLARQVTIRHLLAHNSGLPGYVEFFRTLISPAELYRACLELPIESAPENEANTLTLVSFCWVKHLRSSPAKICLNLRGEIFDPLGMTATRFFPTPEQKSLIPPTEIDSQLRHRHYPRRSAG